MTEQRHTNVLTNLKNPRIHGADRFDILPWLANLRRDLFCGLSGEVSRKD
jgi:hypothetical protein